ncbi:hypothetical protein MRY82_08880 [bacterium]|nr:hypothetical protein [bacterium]
MRVYHYNKGSVLLVFLIILSPIVLYLWVNINNNHLGNKKIRLQTQTDALALHYASYPMDALNAIAMYNKGIEITATRAYMVASALMLLRACALATLLKSPCTRYWAKLEKKAPTFFNQANQLMAYYAKQQDHIKAWAEQAPYQDLTLRNASSTLKKKTLYTLSPKKYMYKLPIIRDNKRTLEKNNPLYQNNNFKRCHTKKEHRLHILNSKLLAYRSKQSISLNVVYKNLKNGAHTVKHYPSIRSIDIIPEKIYSSSSQQYLNFNYAKIKSCETFKKFIHYLGDKLNTKINVPPFYILDHDYFKKGLNIKVEAKQLHKYLTDQSLKSLSQSLNRDTLLKSSAIACMEGDNIFKSEFDIHLCAIHSKEKP